MPDFPQAGLAQTGNVPDVGVSNYGALGDNGLQGNTFNWSGIGAKDYSGTFVFGNSASHVWWKYGDNPEMTPARGNVDLNVTDPFHPVSGFDDGDVLGIDVRYSGQGYTTPTGARDFFIHSYKLVNTGSTAVSNLYAAVYMDWDVSAAGDSDAVILDRTNKLVIQQAVGTTDFVGWALVNNAPLRNLTGISQEIYSYPSSGWLPDSMWARISANSDGIPYFYSDMGSMISTGPYTLAAGESVTVAFAQIGGSSVEDIVNRATLARTLIAPTGCHYVVGDANNSNTFTGLDVTYSVRYFKGGPHPLYSCECTPGNTWYVTGDVNGSCSFTGLDVTYMVRYFKGGAAPIPCPSCPPAPTP